MALGWQLGQIQFTSYFRQCTIYKGEFELKIWLENTKFGYLIEDQIWLHENWELIEEISFFGGRGGGGGGISGKLIEVFFLDELLSKVVNI